jgi:hypothetical protein
MKTLTSYQHPKFRTEVRPGKLVTDGKIRIIVTAINEDEGHVHFRGVQVISQPYWRKGQADARIDASKLKSVGELAPSILARLGLKGSR